MWITFFEKYFFTRLNLNLSSKDKGSEIRNLTNYLDERRKKNGSISKADLKKIWIFILLQSSFIIMLYIWMHVNKRKNVVRKFFLWNSAIRMVIIIMRNIRRNSWLPRGRLLHAFERILNLKHQSRIILLLVTIIASSCARMHVFLSFFFLHLKVANVIFACFRIRSNYF